jgi:hypothetical protein
VPPSGPIMERRTPSAVAAMQPVCSGRVCGWVCKAWFSRGGSDRQGVAGRAVVVVAGVLGSCAAASCTRVGPRRICCGARRRRSSGCANPPKIRCWRGAGGLAAPARGVASR